MKVEGRSFPKSQQAAICLCFQIFHQRYESSSSPTACLPIHPIPSYPNATELTGVYFKPHFKLSSHLKKYQGTQGQKRAKLNCFVVALFHLSRYPPPPPGAPPAPPPPAVAPPPAPPPPPAHFMLSSHSRNPRTKEGKTKLFSIWPVILLSSSPCCCYRAR